MGRWSFPRRSSAGALALALLGAATPAPPVDFANFSGYPPPPCTVEDEGPPAFALTGGTYVWSTKAGDAGLDIQLRSVSFGHLRGDRSLQAAVLLGCDYPGPGFFDQWVDVFDVRAGRGTFVASVHAGKDDDITRSVTIAGNRLVVIATRKKTYALRGSTLVPILQ